MHEIELKLTLPAQVANLLLQAIDQQRANIVQYDLKNTYYDFADGFLAQQKMGLRVRQIENQAILTLKTAGLVDGGLHMRPEYNLPLETAQTPSWQQLQQFELLKHCPQQPLQAIFSTDFTRQQILLNYRASQIEIAFDQGEIIADNQSQPISELEFELKQGSVFDLLDFVGKLPLHSPVYLSSASKAQRGYQLAQNKSIIPQDWGVKWREFIQLYQADVSHQQKFCQLLQIEQQLMEETLLLPLSYFSDNFIATVERVGAFFNLYYFYNENQALIEQLIEQRLATGLTLLNQDLGSQIQQRHQQMFEHIRELIQFHSQSKNNQQSMQNLTERLQSPDYVKGMLNLISLRVNE